jgi:release factor glutamine methyltransferase
MTTLGTALSQAQAQGLDRLDAQLLLLHVLGQDAHDRAWLLAHSSDALPAAAEGRLTPLVTRRAAGEPLAYIIGRREFFGLDLEVNPSVLIPRPDTEILVEWALEHLPIATDQPLRVLDLGTGSGAIALALKAQRPGAQVQALDWSEAALAVARRNAARLSLDITFAQGNWLDGNHQRYHLIVANPPYVADADPHLSALAHEPLQALTAGPDGLQDLRAIIASAPGHLHPGGSLLLEHGHKQAVAVRELLAVAGFCKIASRRDLAGIERCSGGQQSLEPHPHAHASLRTIGSPAAHRPPR